MTAPDARTHEQEEAWVDVGAGLGKPLALARALRPVADILEGRRWHKTQFAAAVRGLVRLCPEAFDLVEAGKISPVQAAIVGNFVSLVIAEGAVPDRAAFEMQQILHLIERERDMSENLFNEAAWSIWSALSWIAFGDNARLCAISGDWELAVRLSESPSPQSMLLSALKANKLHAVKDGQELPDRYWFGRQRLEAGTWYGRDDMMRLWPPRHAKSHQQRACLQWLIELRNNGPQKKTRNEYATEALGKFGTTAGQFQSIWKDATKRAVNPQWGKAGRKSSKTIE